MRKAPTSEACLNFNILIELILFLHIWGGKALYKSMPALTASPSSISPQASSFPFTDSSFSLTSPFSIYICFVSPPQHFSIHIPQFSQTTNQISLFPSPSPIHSIHLYETSFATISIYQVWLTYTQKCMWDIMKNGC